MSAVEIVCSMIQDHEKRLHAETVVMNQERFRDIHGEAFVEGSPHLKHLSVRDLCSQIALEAWQRSATDSRPAHVLDMGAGDGVLTLPYLEMGAQVVAADSSDELLAD